MFKSVWIVAVSLLSMAHCASIGGNNGVEQGNGASATVTAESAPVLNVGFPAQNPGTPAVTNVNSRSLTLGGGLPPVHNSPHAINLNGGFDIGNGYLGYANYHRSQPVVYQPKALPVTTTYIKPEPVEEDWSITPSLSYGYSYKLVPTHAYAPAQPYRPLFNQPLFNQPLFNFSSLNHSFNNLINQFAKGVRRAFPNPHHHHHQVHSPQPQVLVQHAPVVPVEAVPVAPIVPVTPVLL